MKLLLTRNFGLLWSSRLISRLGDWILDVALPIWVYQLTGSGALLGAMVAIEMIPGIVLAPFAGVLADRIDRKKVAIITNLLLGLSVLLLFLVRSPEQIWLVFVVALLNALLGVFLSPALNAMVPELVPTEQLLQANSLLTMTVQSMRLIGPAIGGMLIALAGPRLAFGLDALSFFLAALCLAGIHWTREEQAEVEELTSVWDDIRAGLVMIQSNFILRTTLVVWSVMMLAAGVVSALLVVFVHEALAGTDASFGYILSAQGLGMLLGGIAIMALGERVKPISAFTIGLLAFSVLFLAGANAPNVPIAALLVCGMGVTMAIVAISDTTIFQTATPSHFRARVLASNSAVSSLMILIGAVGAGVLSDILGVRIVFNLAAILSLISALLALSLLGPNQIVPEPATYPANN